MQETQKPSQTQITLRCALVGLARAMYAASPDVDIAPAEPLLRRALAAVSWQPGSRAGALMDLVKALRAEKTRLAPDCAACAHPCGRTAEPSPNALTSPDPATAALKEMLWAALAVVPESAALPAVWRGLFAAGEEWEPDQVRGVLAELEAANQG